MSTTDPTRPEFTPDHEPLSAEEERLLRSVVAGYRHDGTPDRQHDAEADPHSERARALLTSVLATPGGYAVPVGPDEPGASAQHRPPSRPDATRPATSTAAAATTGPGRPGRRSRRSRFLALGAGALLLAGAAVVLPNLTGTDNAFATWTRVPSLITDARALDVANECREGWKQHNDPALGGPMEGIPSNAVLDEMRVVIAERRGQNTYAVLAGDGWTSDCLTNETGVFSFLPWARSYGRSSGLSPEPDRALVPADGVGMVWRSGSSGSGTFQKEYNYENVYAQVGDDVTAVTLHTARGDIEASVAGGFLAAWWPVENMAGLDGDLAATLRLRDGSVVEVPSLDQVGAAVGEASGLFTEGPGDAPTG